MRAEQLADVASRRARPRASEEPRAAGDLLADLLAAETLAAGHVSRLPVAA